MSEHTPEKFVPFTAEDLTLTPRWVVEAKYRSLLQIVKAKNDWADKYPLLERIVDSLLAQARKEERETILKSIRDKKAAQYEPRTILEDLEGALEFSDLDIE